MSGGLHHWHMCQGVQPLFVVVNLEENCSRGLALDVWPQGPWQVLRVQEGKVLEYNNAASERKVVKPQDFIVSVNDFHVVEDYQRAYEAYMQQPRLKLEIVRPKHYTIKVAKCGLAWGFIFVYQPKRSNCIRITRIEPGAIEDFSRQVGEDQQVEVGDFIESANGVRGGTAIVQELNRSEEVDLVMFRVDDRELPNFKL